MVNSLHLPSIVSAVLKPGLSVILFLAGNFILRRVEGILLTRIYEIDNVDNLINYYYN